MRNHRRFLPLLSIVVLAACAAPRLPEDFVKVERAPGELKAVAADDSLYWVRRFRADARGDLAFWRETLLRHYTEVRGYTLLEERPVRAGGDDAIEFRFDATIDGVPRSYLLVLMADPRWSKTDIVTAEYVADRDEFETHLGAVREALEIEARE